MAHHSVGSEKLEFSEKFFPLPRTTAHARPALNGNPFANLENAGHLSEAEIVNRFVTAVNTHDLVPGMKLLSCASGSRPDDGKIDGDSQKVDIAFYHAAEAPTDGHPDWADQVLPVQFKSRETLQDPFDDHEGGVWEADAASRTKVRGQIISYAELLFQVQQREALFMLLIIGRRCRFMRWDRSGTIVTAAMDYVSEWELFCEILWRIANRSDAQLGMDPSATRLRPGDAEFDRMDLVAKPNDDDIDHRERMLSSEQLPDQQFKFIRDAFRDSLQPGWPRYKLEVPDGDEVREFLVAKPAFRAKGLAGRGTRGYVALDTTTGRFVWLKDAWRVDYPGMRQEGEILSQLNKAGIPNFPTLICHGDIRDQQTLTPVWWERRHPLHPEPNATSSRTFAVPSSSKSTKRKRRDDDTEQTLVQPKGHSDFDPPPFREDCPLRLHTHYRLVVKEVGMSLSQFQYGRQLVGIMYDCIYAHEQAATHPDTKLLHRDVSAGNVLIYPRVVVESGNVRLQWGGLLADWEMSRTVHKDAEDRRPHQPERMGTWQYMSVALLSRNSFIVGILDELESFLHVILYHAARYLPSNCDDFTIASYIYDYFDTYGVDGDVYVCGDKKAHTIKTGILVVNDRKILEFSSPMDELLSEVLSWFRAHYFVANYSRKVEKPQPDSEEMPSDSSSEDETPTLPFALPSLPTATSTSQPRRKAAVKDKAPTEVDTVLASYVQVHQYMKDLFWESFHDPRWKPEKKRDHFTKGWKLFREDPQLDVPAHVNKKRRIDGPQTGLAASAPALLLRPPDARNTYQVQAHTAD
ncbi:hypothetical protein K466DRAFT_668164 [Polyporus arcularius HHB13444]|uniref:Fungal-type protein kinase domain-containing protein n=1 Tax=Polyporus arcularius HHB13444 TaxID=1314778 RepID=A0A5C3NPR7_9APHY|nr:hypothetical protein K466DRAFT_668164 [Polyporus arcularius HHB13444]